MGFNIDDLVKSVYYPNYAKTLNWVSVVLCPSSVAKQ